jgi:hypothetical protein
LVWWYAASSGLVGLPVHETAAPPELQQRLEAYVGLIEQLVSCPAGEEPAVLGAVAEQAYQQEETRPIGEFLGQVAIQLQGAFGQALQERLAAYQQLVAAGASWIIALLSAL